MKNSSPRIIQALINNPNLFPLYFLLLETKNLETHRCSEALLDDDDFHHLVSIHISMIINRFRNKKHIKGKKCSPDV
jgi:hypothetical protein